MPKARSAKRVRTPTVSRPWVASVAVVVSDVARAKRWYTEALGLELLTDGGHWITVGRRGRGGALHLCHPEDGSLEPGTSGILLLVDGDLSARCEELRAKGVDFTGPLTEHPWGWDATVRDPDGNELLLMSG